MSLNGKVALVTGAAQGMGAATAQLFASSGASVVVSDVNEAAGETVVQQIAANGFEATFIRADVASSTSVKELIAGTVATYGRLDCAVNNAAVEAEIGALAEFDEDDFDRVMAVDLKGVALCLKHELSQMIAQGGGGSIVNIASVNSFRPQLYTAAYTAAKHGVVGLTKVAALENGAAGIRVNAVAPGAIMTPMLRTSLDRQSMDEAAVADALSMLGRFGRPEEVAEASKWLASDLSSYVTGSVLNVDAGYVAR
jgi:NAD(P)-dependent dehydrogenase (short-subunit alcohol dehydrogenase family)